MNARLPFSACLALVALTSFGQDLNKRISFSAPASRAVVLFPDLGKQIGLDLKTIAQTEDEVLLIRAHDVTIKELLDRIAKAANAEWRLDRKTYRLIRPDRLS